MAKERNSHLVEVTRYDQNERDGNVTELQVQLLQVQLNHYNLHCSILELGTVERSFFFVT